MDWSLICICRPVDYEFKISSNVNFYVLISSFIYVPHIIFLTSQNFGDIGFGLLIIIVFFQSVFFFSVLHHNMVLIFKTNFQILSFVYHGLLLRRGLFGYRYWCEINGSNDIEKLYLRME